MNTVNLFNTKIYLHEMTTHQENVKFNSQEIK